MTNPLICARCGSEIRPGDEVSMISPDFDPEVDRIVVDPDVLITHFDCSAAADR